MTRSTVPSATPAPAVPFGYNPCPSMANFMGGSAPAMAAQIAGGFVRLSTATLKGYAPGDLQSLRQELEKMLREARAEVPPQDDALAQQSRNHKIARLNSAVQVVQNKLTARN